jgi:endonuclease-3
MSRGNMTRQPSRAGRHERVVNTAPRSATKGSRALSPKLKPRKPLLATVVQGTAKKAKAAGKAGSAAKAAASQTAKGYNPTSPARVNELLKRLDQRYPNVVCALHHKNAWELLVATILSAQCTDIRVNMVTPILFKKYPTPQHFAALKPQELEADIRSTGFFRNKSKSIVGAAKKVVEEFGGEVPHTMEELLRIPGAARKTANVVLGSWFKISAGVVVDTHVLRISRRLELTRNGDPQKIEQDLMKVIPQTKWIEFSHQIIHHGRAICIARKPKCAECNLEDLCHAADKTWSTVEIHRNALP